MNSGDGAHATIATTTGIVAYGFTLEEIVFVLWSIYVALLILIKIPEFLEKHTWIGSAFRRIFGRRR